MSVRVVVTALVALVALLIPASQAAAVEYRVNTLTDPANDQGMCATSGACSLRQAVNTANADMTADTIVFDVTGIHSLAGAGSDVDLELNITQPVTITGNGDDASGTTIDGADLVRVLFVGVAGSVTINDLRIQNGRVFNPISGAGINHNLGTLTLNRVTVTENEIAGMTVPSAPAGAGISTNQNTALAMNESTVSANVVSDSNFGAGIVIDASGNAGTLDLNRSTVSGNMSIGTGAGGGGIFFRGDGTQTIRNSTISGNSATASGGGILTADSANITITNTTIAGNTAPSGAGIQNNSATTIVKNTILENNGPNCSVTSGGISSAAPGNNIDSGTSCSFNVLNGNQVGVSPLLLSLTDNGGPTATHALMPGSPAIDTASADCGGAPIAGVDQRGVTRPQGTSCDIGAFELEPLPPDTGSGAGQAAPVAAPATGLRAAALKRCKKKKGKARKKCRKRALKLPA